MTWNYRVVKFSDEDGEDFYELKEVYYNEDKEPEYYGDAVIAGETIEMMWDEMARFEDALKHAPIDGKVFHRESDPDIIF
jgi:hypothetical protein